MEWIGLVFEKSVGEYQINGCSRNKKTKNNKKIILKKDKNEDVCVGEIIIGQLRTVSSIRKCKGEFCKGHCFCFLSFFVFLFVCSVQFVLYFYVFRLHYITLC